MPRPFEAGASRATKQKTGLGNYRPAWSKPNKRAMMVQIAVYGLLLPQLGLVLGKL
jgi:hypothetical protein